MSLNRRQQIIDGVAKPPAAPAPAQPLLLTLTRQQYERLEAEFRLDPRVTDPIQAGRQLGIQEVLRAVRTGFTTA